jgi:hypothetical protein
MRPLRTRLIDTMWQHGKKRLTHEIEHILARGHGERGVKVLAEVRDT